MRKSYEKQILNHNVEKFDLIVKANLDKFFSAKILTQAKQNAELKFNPIKKAKKIMENLKQHFEKDEHWKLQHSCLSINYQCLARTVVNKADIIGLIDMLAVFIK